MTMLADAKLERLCDLFASGSMGHAKEIARLLVQEIDEHQPAPKALLTSNLLRWAHRRQLALHLQSLSGADVSKPIQQINDDIAAIEAGLAKVSDEPYLATVPRINWL